MLKPKRTLEDSDKRKQKLEQKSKKKKYKKLPFSTEDTNRMAARGVKAKRNQLVPTFGAKRAKRILGKLSEKEDSE